MKNLLEQHANNPTKLLVNLEQWNDPEAPEQNYVVFKGSSSSLRFLGKLLTTFADEDHGSTFFMHPTGAGSAHFESGSTCGIYLAKTTDETKL